MHFLDSPEQALLVIPLWSDVVERGGGTVVCADGIKYIAKHLVSCCVHPPMLLSIESFMYFQRRQLTP